MPQADLSRPTLAAVPGTAGSAEPPSITFDLQSDTFALPAALVQEIIDVVPGSTVPGASPMAATVINFRGRIIPIVDLRVAFGMPQAAPTIDSRFVVVELTVAGEPLLCGLYTDKVHEVASFSLEMAEAPPQVGLRWPRDHIRGLIRRNGSITVLPDLPAILAPLVQRHGAALTSVPHS